MPVAALGFALARAAHCVSPPHSSGRAIKPRHRRLLLFLSFVSHHHRLNSGELPSPVQCKIAPKKQCPSFACSLRLQPTCCYHLISPRPRCPRSSSSRPTTSTETPFHRGQCHPVSCCPCLWSLQLRLDAVMLNPFLLGRFAHCSHRNSVADEVCSAVTAVTVDSRHRSSSGLVLCFNTFGVSC